MASFSQPEWLPKASGEAGVEAEGTPRHPLHHLLLDRKCVMEWEEPHDSTLYCLQTDGNHLLATGSSYYGVVRLWDRRQRACLHAFPLTSTPLSSPVYCLRFTTRHLYAALSYSLRVLDFQNP